GNIFGASPLQWDVLSSARSPDGVILFGLAPGAGTPGKSKYARIEGHDGSIISPTSPPSTDTSSASVTSLVYHHPSRSFVAGLSNGVIETSGSGVNVTPTGFNKGALGNTWTARETPNANARSSMATASPIGTAIVATTSGLTQSYVYSENGVDWTAGTFPVAVEDPMVVRTGGPDASFVVVDADRSLTAPIADPTAWTDNGFGSGAGDPLVSIAVFNRLIVVATETSKVMRATMSNGASWAPVFDAAAFIVHIAAGDGQIVAVDASENIYWGFVLGTVPEDPMFEEW
ncbi:MAG TPA: hypothetical protein VF989_19000, partial [Polyangiaceae bacterium]